jgi:hypothetical protein
MLLSSADFDLSDPDITNAQIREWHETEWIAEYIFSTILADRGSL